MVNGIEGPAGFIIGEALVNLTLTLVTLTAG